MPKSVDTKPAPKTDSEEKPPASSSEDNKAPASGSNGSDNTDLLKQILESNQAIQASQTQTQTTIQSLTERVEKLETDKKTADEVAAKIIGDAGLHKPLGDDPNEDGEPKTDTDWSKASADEVKSHWASIEDKREKATFFINYIQGRKDI